MRDLLRAARAEEQRLLRELEATPTFRRLQAVRAFLAGYDAAATPTVAEPTRKYSRRPNTLSNRVCDVAVDHLREQRHRTKAPEILQVLRAHGIEMPGTSPVQYVAAILSKSELFDNVRGEGYGLVEWAAHDENQEG
jgi:hypothetical protein